MRIQCLLASVIFAGGTLPLHAQPTASAAVSLAPSQALADLFAKSDADNLARNPVSRLFRGDTSAITRPVLAPVAANSGMPCVRTANASCVGKTSMYVFKDGSCLK